MYITLRIGIPNQVLLPKKAAILEDNINMTKNERNIYLDEYLEDLLHQQIISALRPMKKKAIVIKGFKSDNIFGFKIEEAKKLRENEESELKKNARTRSQHGKSATADLNDIEKELIAVLKEDDKNIDDEVNRSIELHKQWKQGSLSNPKKTGCWLFDKECLKQSKC